MRRKSSRQPDWVKALMQEMLKPPQFLQGIMEDQKNAKNQETSASSADNHGTGPQTSSSQAGHHSEATAPGQSSATTQRHKTRPQANSSRQSHGYDTADTTLSKTKRQTKNAQATSSSQSTTWKTRRITPRSSSPAPKADAYAIEMADADDWVPTSLNEQEISSTSANDWRRVLRQMEIPPAVVKRYNWKVTQALPYRNIVQIKTAKSTYALKEANIEAQRVEFIKEVENYVRQHGFTHFARLAMTRQQHPYVRQDGHVYYATRWIPGRTVSFADNQDIGKVAVALAGFHEASRGFESSNYNPPMEFDLKQMLKRRYEDLKILLSQADGKGTKGTFDKLFLSMEDRLRKDADESLSLMDDADCQDYLLHEEFQAGICHLDVIPSNFIYDDAESVRLIDLDLATYAPRVLDISHLLRRALQVQNWNSEVAYVCFLNFDKVNRITREEYVLIEALLRFPYRAWRLANTRYRVFAESGQVSALKRYQNQEDSRQQFLRELGQQIK